jgi:hypothetical protein
MRGIEGDPGIRRRVAIPEDANVPRFLQRQKDKLDIL